jgi:Mg2+ and Co2+ transporter CorA
MCSEEIWKKAKDGTVPRNIFGGVWQRLMLGALCSRCRNDHDNVVIEEPELQLTEYNEDAYDTEIISEEELLFRQPLRTRGRRNMDGDNEPLECPARWLRADSASADRLLRMGVKFFVHPMATDDAITTARTGMTKIDRYRHQYFVSLEVYSMNPEMKITSELSRSSRNLDSIEDLEPPMVGPNVTRSSMFLVATGSPSSGHRDWLLSFVGKPVAGIKDPLDFFSNSTEAATNVLNLIKQDLESHGRMREYQSDFLLYTILDRSAHELGPICWAYGHRLRWMQNCLDKQKLRMPTEYLDEVSKMRLEMQELKQWVGQMKGILKTLAEDCRNIRKDGESIPWNFGAHAEGRGKSLLMFLSNTDATLEQTSDRLATLNDLARNFLDSHARLRDGFTNNILLALTISTAIYAPAQLLAGIYGTNFVNDEGTPAVPELTWKYGYPVFITACVGMILAGFILAWYCLRTNARR